MKLILANDLVSKLKNCHLILDTNVFLHAIDNNEFYDFLADLHEGGCGLFTIPSVVFEFARGAKTIEEFNWYVDFINTLGVGVYKDVENHIMGDKAFSVLLKSQTKDGRKGISYTDFLLLMLLHKFHHLHDKIYLMTSNYNDVPLTIFEREDIIALEFRDGVQSQALYRNSPEKLVKLTTSI